MMTHFVWETVIQLQKPTTSARNLAFHNNDNLYTHIGSTDKIALPLLWWWRVCIFTKLIMTSTRGTIVWAFRWFSFASLVIVSLQEVQHIPPVGSIGSETKAHESTIIRQSEALECGIEGLDAILGFPDKITRNVVKIWSVKLYKLSALACDLSRTLWPMPIYKFLQPIRHLHNLEGNRCCDLLQLYKPRPATMAC